ncbi:MAG: alpha/beta fold hydrolase [Gemmatimonadales bacterium]|nr:alpha/beta fold hydrolase [Gemmatimonadales bacterium]
MRRTIGAQRAFRAAETVALALLVTAFAVWSPISAVAQAPTLHWVSADGHALAVWEKSVAGADAAILLVHGRTWSTLPDFDLQVPGESLSLMDGLNEENISTYGVDLRGYGETDRDDTGWNTPNRAVADVASVLRWIRERHPDQPVHLFGWSLGSMVSQLTAQRHPDLIDRLVLFGYPTRPGAEQPFQEPSAGPPARATTAEAAASDFLVEGSISANAIQAYVEAALDADPVRSDWTSGHQWNDLDPAEVTTPTLVIHGEHDPLAPMAAQAALVEGLGTSDKAWVVVPGGDHAAFLEAPRPYFIAVLGAFLLRGGL